MVRVTDVKGGFLALEQCFRVSKEVYAEFTRRYQPKRGDIVFSRVGSYGNTSLVITDDPFCLGQNTALISPKINPRYLHFVLESQQTKRVIHKLAVGSTQKTVSLKSISELPIPVPPQTTQDGIASILGSLDDKIDLNRKTAKTLEEMAQALFRSWFVDFDPVIDNALAAGNTIPPEFEARAARRQESRARAQAEGRPFGLAEDQAKLFPDRFGDSELGPIPAAWKPGQFKYFCAQHKEQARTESIKPDEAYVGLEHIQRKCLCLGDWGYGQDVASQKSRFGPDHILFGKLRPYFHKVCLPPFSGVCSTDILVLRPVSDCFTGHAVMIAYSDELVRHVTGHSDGTRMPRTRWDDLANFAVVIPTSEVAALFTHLARPWLEYIRKSPQLGRTLGQIRDALLPKLISGEIQVDGQVH